MVLLGLHGALAIAAAPAGVVFQDPWIRAPIGSQTVTAGYCDISNHTQAEVVVTGFVDPAGTRRIEIHETVQDDGRARMRLLPRLTIPPGQTLSLQPGGKHLMLFDMDAKAGVLDLAVEFHDGGTQPVRFQIRPLASTL